ncbi:hypothetical protein Tco_1227879 [Tanacetum coccineum]
MVTISLRRRGDCPTVWVAYILPDLVAPQSLDLDILSHGHVVYDVPCSPDDLARGHCNSRKTIILRSPQALLLTYAAYADLSPVLMYSSPLSSAAKRVTVQSRGAAPPSTFDTRPCDDDSMGLRTHLSSKVINYGFRQLCLPYSSIGFPPRSCFFGLGAPFTPPPPPYKATIPSKGDGDATYFKTRDLCSQALQICCRPADPDYDTVVRKFYRMDGGHDKNLRPEICIFTRADGGWTVCVDSDWIFSLAQKAMSFVTLLKRVVGTPFSMAQDTPDARPALLVIFLKRMDFLFAKSATLQTKLLRDVGIVAPGSTFDDALCVFNNAMEIDFLSNPSEVAAPKLMKKMADIYFTRVTKDAESSYSLSPRQMALWQSQKEDHTSDWLRVVPISGLGQTMNGKTYRSVLCYRLGVPLFSVSKPCSACSRVFIEDIYGDHAISCAGIIGIKHRHNMVRDTLVDICFRSGISAGKEVDIGLDGGHDKKLRPADMLLYSWDGGLDVCVDLTGSSPLTQTGMSDFAPGRAVTDAAQRKRGKYMTKCADIGYGFLPFSFSSFGELEKDAVTLLKRVRNFSMAQDIGARAASHIFNRIGFSIAKGVGAQIVSRLPSNVL